MRRFLAAWDAFWNTWNYWSPECPYAHVVWMPTRLSDRKKRDFQAIADGLAHARRYPAKKGVCGFRMEGGRG